MQNTNKKAKTKDKIARPITKNHNQVKFEDDDSASTLSKHFPLRLHTEQLSGHT